MSPLFINCADAMMNEWSLITDETSFLISFQALTLADKFMVGVYSFIFVSFMVSIILLKLQRERMYKAAETFYLYAEGVVSEFRFVYFEPIYLCLMNWGFILLKRYNQI